MWPEQFPTILSADKLNQPRVINVAFNLISAVFGGGCEKYWPMKAINGLVIELQLENPQECLGYRFVPILAADLAKLLKPNHDNDYARQNNWIAGVASDNQQQGAIGDLIGGWETYTASNTQCKGASQNCAQQMTYAAGSTWQVEPTPASNSTDFAYVVTKPSIQLNRVCINGAVGDEIVNAGKRALNTGWAFTYPDTFLEGSSVSDTEEFQLFHIPHPSECILTESCILHHDTQRKHG